nr:hypothetical protein [Paracoccus saliphilus]
MIHHPHRHKNAVTAVNAGDIVGGSTLMAQGVALPPVRTQTADIIKGMQL